MRKGYRQRHDMGRRRRRRREKEAARKAARALHARQAKEAGSFGAASDVRLLMKDGVAMDMVIPVESHVVRRQHSGRRRSGRAKAMAFMAAHGRSGATALEIGIASVAGTRRAHAMGRAGIEQMGLALGVALAREGLAVATKGNRFVLMQHAKQAVPPVVAVEDTPPPGFIRVPGGEAWSGTQT
jgi:hypothetical protein